MYSAPGRTSQNNLCASLSTCVECKLSGENSGLKSRYSEACPGCDQSDLRKIKVFSLKEGDSTEEIGIDPRTSDIEDKVECSLVDESGCLRVFWYTYHKENNGNNGDNEDNGDDGDDDKSNGSDENDPGILLVWSDKAHNCCNYKEVFYIILEFQGKAYGPTGLEILVPAGGFIASLERMFASLTFSIIIMIIKKCLSPLLSLKKMFVPHA